MAAATGSFMSTTSLSCSLKQNQGSRKMAGLNSVSLSLNGRKFTSLTLPRLSSDRFRISCAAKPETVVKVCKIVKDQLALSDDIVVSAESTFAGLGADSLDTVEIVMGIEEAFGVSVEEESAQSITTVQDAADLVEKLIKS
ncbi:acyl carrier protein 1, chloroplastic-like [Impatiens glandulifera]|uniref:acyl carrier protein 1, chloroplastic-like n=1 Tax=Impatiens glandulifera TaxID=253017 RepID=UPI001FB0A400|nr:acyl carrier protein 1, chloroplastic-like [Impatiens glandulifera]